jgi:hypothetical protein
MQAKALRNINLVDKNYAHKNDLLVIQDQMASILAQNRLLQEQLAATQIDCALPVPPNEDSMDDNTPVSICGGSLNMREWGEAQSLGSASNQGYLGLICLVDSSMEEDEPMQICGGGDNIPEANAMGTKMTVGMNCQVQVSFSQQPASPVQASCALLPLALVHVPYPPGIGIHNRSYQLCPGWMSVEDHIYPVPGFDPITQKQMLRSIWRPRFGTFKTVLDTIPGELPDRSKVP